ncbi:hypothetical protein [Bacillus wiedmannii]|uniref:hypothetical protein n=1 Tax=Bacillus wiedmannii TaxID=1890302 RepID=UPI000BEF689E|nr:hypothetical protein [Bacillus wiedmannii]PEN61628.1 hypothetical protein CN576_21600 [Bacillus wiedmannii]
MWNLNEVTCECCNGVGIIFKGEEFCEIEEKICKKCNGNGMYEPEEIEYKDGEYLQGMVV